MAIETSGFNLAIPQAPIVTPALTNLAPLNISAPGVAMQPAKIQTPSTAVSEGIALGLGAIGKGITAAYQNSQAEKEQNRRAGLEERRMQIEEARFAAERSDKSAALARQLQDRISATGADTFPGESNLPVAGQAAPVGEATADSVDPNAARLRRVGTFEPSYYAGGAKPFEKERYSREANTFRFDPEEAFKAPTSETPAVEVVPKPLSQGTPAPAPSAAPTKVLADVAPVLSPRPKLTPAEEMEDALGFTVGKTFDPFGLYKKEAEAYRKMTPEQQKAFIASSQPNDPAKNLRATLAGLESAYQGVKNWVNEPWQPSPEERLAVEQANKPTTAVAEKSKPEEIAPPQASYQFDQQKMDQLQQSTQQPLKLIAPYLAASTGTYVPPELPLKKQEYPLDLSEMYDIKYTETPEVAKPAAQQPKSEVPATQGIQFDVPPRPTADQIPKDFATRDYDAARQEQAKNYGFYYEPMGQIETHQDQNGLWYKVVRNPEKASIIEQKLGRLESMKQRYDKFQLQQQNTVDREQTKFYSNPDVKAFTAPNGMRQSFSRFVKDYDAILKNPEASGISDIGLLDMFGRAEGGGRITEAQAALALRAVGIMDKPEQLIQKLQGGARLSQPQRDQMMRVIAEDHSAQASLANQQIAMVRKKLQRQGITDEEMLPQPYIIPITKWETEDAKKQVKAETTKLLLQRTQAQQAGNQSEIDKINQRMQEFKDQLDPIYEMEKKSKNSVIINLHDIEHSPQGWAGGAVSTFQQQGE